MAMTETESLQPEGPTLDSGREPYRRPSAFANWFWFVLKNLIGWTLILVSGPIGFALPGPGGLPVFLIGFALITFPGKRQITARVLRGRRIARESLAFRRGVALIALLLPGAVIGYLWYERLPEGIRRHGGLLAAGYVAGATLIFLLGLRSDVVLNKLLRFVPRVRRRVRPWLRHRGIDLLPARRRRRRNSSGPGETRDPDLEIMEINPRFRSGMRASWMTMQPWLRRSLGIGVTIAIFWWILRPVVRDWPLVRQRVMDMSSGHFFLAAAMFALFLFAFRAMSWWRILLGFGYRLPIAATVRIWSTSELARYLPLAIWQVLGRIYLVKPYGVRGSVCSTSQILELAIFLLANLMVAIGCLVWLGIKNLHGPAGNWLFAAMALVPVLMFLLHPRVLYTVVNRILNRLGKPPISDRMGFRALGGLLGWAILGLFWQSLAIWFIAAGPLHLPLAKWWVIAGAYSLAWCAGFLAVWAPGGLGVREVVFIAAMQFALPRQVRQHIGDAELKLFLAFLAVLLRLWATTGEVILASIAYLLDFRGALGRYPAPCGPVARSDPEPAAPERELQAVDP